MYEKPGSPNVWCNISGEAAGQVWNWPFLGMKGLTPFMPYTAPLPLDHDYAAELNIISAKMVTLQTIIIYYTLPTLANTFVIISMATTQIAPNAWLVYLVRSPLTAESPGEPNLFSRGPDSLLMVQCVWDLMTKPCCSFSELTLALCSNNSLSNGLLRPGTPRLNDKACVCTGVQDYMVIFLFGSTSANAWLLWWSRHNHQYSVITGHITLLLVFRLLGSLP